MAAMSLLGNMSGSEVGLRLLLSPLSSNIVVRTACCTVGVVLPVYSTCKAIENNDHDEQQKWLLYWAAYGSFSLVETFSDKLISWFPLYYHMKFAFLVWLQLPSVYGAKQLYTNHLRPFFLRHQARIDQILGIAYGEMVKIISSHQTEIQFAKSVILKILGSVGYILKGGAKPQQPQLPAVEDQTRTSYIESDLDD